MIQKIATLFVMLLLLAGCGLEITSTLKDDRKLTQDGIVYELFYIEDMPCIRVGRDGVVFYDGVTCDWSRWKIIGGE